MANPTRMPAPGLGLMRDVLLDGETACMHWDGPVSSDGYPVQYRAGRQEIAHRVAFEACYGEIPAWARLKRLCPTPCCISPFHHALRAPREVGRRLNFPTEELRGIRELLLSWRKRKPGFQFTTDTSKPLALEFPPSLARSVAVTLGVSRVLVLAAYADLVLAADRRSRRRVR